MASCSSALKSCSFTFISSNPLDFREFVNLLNINSKSLLFKNVNEGSQVWMSHSDTIENLPLNSKCIASTEDVKNAAFSIVDERLYGIQFHPEVYHSKDGKKILENFLLKIAGIKPDWTPDVFSEKTISEIKSLIGNDKVILGLSGGVDSTVAGVLINKAIGDNLQCIFVNNGLLRKNEFQDVLEQYKGMGLNVKGVDASEYFINKLSSVSDPEKKRKIIGKAFIDVFDKESKLIDGAKWLAQGTIYPDCLLYTSPSPRDKRQSRMPSSA